MSGFSSGCTPWDTGTGPRGGNTNLSVSSREPLGSQGVALSDFNKALWICSDGGRLQIERVLKTPCGVATNCWLGSVSRPSSHAGTSFGNLPTLRKCTTSAKRQSEPLYGLPQRFSKGVSPSLFWAYLLSSHCACFASHENNGCVIDKSNPGYRASTHESARTGSTAKCLPHLAPCVGVRRLLHFHSASRCGRG